jgi:hypothetical protein
MVGDPLPADDARAALVEWAKKEISSVTDTRFEVAKFLFSASTATLGFFVAAWKLIHPGTSFSGAIVCCVSFLCVDVAVAMWIFWPIFHYFGSRSDIHREHERLAKRLMTEGAIWSALWAIGIGFGLWAILK